jgi:hypothetical protein
MYVQHFSIRHSLHIDYRSHYLLSNVYLEPFFQYTPEHKVEQDSLFLYCIWCMFYLQTNTHFSTHKLLSVTSEVFNVSRPRVLLLHLTQTHRSTAENCRDVCIYEVFRGDKIEKTELGGACRA